MAGQFETIELLLGDTRGQGTYELGLLAGALLGDRSPQRLGLAQKVCSQQPLETYFHGELAGRLAEAGHREPASETLERVLASMSRYPPRPPPSSFHVAVALGRLARTSEAISYARDYLLRLPPERRQTTHRLPLLLKAIPELRVELPRLLRAPRQT